MKAQAKVAHNLRKWRVKRAISQENLAVDAFIDRTYVSRLERGLENPTVLILDKLARALGMDVSDLLLRPAPGEKAPKALRAGRKRRI
jgi:transcriptional regulator with XRE-family HTH domain